ncbi:hypothetical protein DRP53_02740 [candidate division WOR-3 bacterium]|uniref:GxGYxYP putative glycoside hydrolase C-terminal domain-containing protein n=1 Tax=candidate division WOR-3 bacterium TaxID=2052148 RepID=A0A660SMB7_UNCW3|nr:MAG: hypothetical protein DRP53_02740 [candidate division WOR-3 bacterium]
MCDVFKELRENVSLYLVFVSALAVGNLLALQKGLTKIDVVDLRGKDYKTRLLALSLQGIVNREEPRIYVLWESKDRFGNPSEEWLEYYESKGWIIHSKTDLRSALRKYRSEIKGFVVYDPKLRHTINIAITMAGVYDFLVAHPDFVPILKRLGFEMREDLRRKWRNKYEAYEWQFKNIFPYCNKDLIASAMPVEHPKTHEFAYYMIRPIADYVIMRKVCALDLIPSERMPRDYELLKKYYDKMNRYAVVLGYPFSNILERRHVELASRHGLRVLLAHATSVNFSIHSQMPAERTYKQDHITNVSLEDKIYIAFAMSDLGLNTIQDRYYGAWDDPRRGSIKVSWWLDGLVKDFCPGLVQYYYETKTSNDFFYGAHVGGRIRPSDFPDLEGYLERGKKYLEGCDLNTVGFSNHGKYDEKVFETYSKILNNCTGFFYGWPGYEWGREGELLVFEDKVWVVTAVRAEKDVKETVQKISLFIREHKERPLFLTVLVVLGNYPDIGFLDRVKKEIDLIHPGQVEWVRGDELILLAGRHMNEKWRQRRKYGSTEWIQN